MATVTVAATQFACSANSAQNVDRAEALVRQAAKRGARIIQLQELFETPYFCKDQLAELFDLAQPAEDHPTIARMQDLARELEVVLPISFFEAANNAYYNSLAVIDADGEMLGLYRKSHIPDGTGYQEKFYFNPGDTGFKVWDTAYARIGCGICWDQWFPECARAMALMGAELLLYPTAIGSEPNDPNFSSADHWQRAMQGHAACNMVPVVASNRIGREDGQTCSLTFYGRSFIAGARGEIITEAGAEEAILTADFDFQALRRQRAGWGLFRDRRPDLYTVMMTLDGQNWSE
ncbi:N-carbamoylputrescine amidase [Dongia mobilis]|jgi:N-carbamoylputrescine amidase|uniref:N-carbamoylputrescine amidase n=1 Tax=Dongia sp. TaxID=1977262 RepID=UPI0026EE0823